MKSIYLPLLAITAVLAVTGIEIFQVNPVNTSGTETAELVYVIMLAVLIGLGILLSKKRSRELRSGLPLEDEMSKMQLRKAGSITFFISLIIWLAMLFINVHDIMNIEVRFLFAYGLIAICFVFLVSWTIINFGGTGHEKQD